MYKAIQCTLLLCPFILNLAQAQEYKTLKQLVYYPTYNLNANIISLKQSLISPQISGHIQKIYVEIGSRVKANQILAKMDCFNHDKQLQLTKISVKKNQQTISLLNKQIQRERELQKRKNISQSQLEVTDNKLIIAKLSLNEQKTRVKQLEYTVGLCQIKSPFSGFIAQKLTEVGQAAGPGTVIFEVINPANKVLRVMAPQNLITSLLKGKNARFNYQQNSYPVTHKISIPKIQANRSQEIHFNLPNRLDAVIGMSGKILWQDGRPHIPSKYLKRYNKKLGIYLLSGSQTVFKYLPAAIEGQAVITRLPLSTKLIVSSPHLKSIKVVD